MCKVETKVLSDALKKAKKAVDTHASWELLMSFLLVARGSTLTVVAVALGEWAVAVKVKAEVKQEGKVLADARTLTDVVSQFSGQVELSTVARTRNGEQKPFLKVAADGRESLIPYPLGEPDEFPLPPKVGGEKIVMDGAKLAEAIGDAAVAVSKDEVRLALTGILFEVTPQSGSLVLVATDGYRLVVRQTPIQQTDISDDSVSFLLPGRPLKKWASFKPQGTVVIQIVRDGDFVSHVAFRSQDVSTAFWTMDVKFPDYRGVYLGTATLQNVVSFRTESRQFLKALKALKPVVPPRKKADPFSPIAPVVMRVNGSVDLMVSGPLGEADVRLDGKIQKDDPDTEVKVGVQWEYLADAVKRAAKRKLPAEVQIFDPKKPIFARFGEDYDYLVMPVNLQ